MWTEYAGFNFVTITSDHNQSDFLRKLIKILSTVAKKLLYYKL